MADRDLRVCFSFEDDTGRPSYLVVAPSLYEAGEATWTEDGSRVEDIDPEREAAIDWYEYADPGAAIRALAQEI